MTTQPAIPTTTIRRGLPACLSKPADTPQFNVCPNASHPELVHLAIGSGVGGYDISPESAEQFADQLLDAAASARLSGGAR